MVNPKKEEILKEYDSNKQSYKDFSFLVRNLIESYANQNNLKYQITNREKDSVKLSEKIDRKYKDGKIYNSLDDIEDLAGVRIVFYLEDDQNNFLSGFLNEFKECVEDVKDASKAKGYRGTHIIFKLNGKRSELSEYKKFLSKKCEIQVSTIFFHGWSEVEHDILYKTEGDKKLLKDLGLEDIEKAFQKTMSNHIEKATWELNYINQKYQKLRQAGSLLESEFLQDISLSKDNDEIHSIMEILSDDEIHIYSRKYDEVLAVASLVINKNPLPSKLLRELGDYKIYGKTHKDLIFKAIELLLKIRYYRTDDVLRLIYDLSKYDDVEINKKALDVVKKISNYDFNVLTKTDLGFEPQKILIRFIENLPDNEKLEGLDFIKTVLDGLLNLNIEGNEWKDENTISFIQGSVDPNSELKNIRRKSMDVISDLYEKVDNPKERLKLIQILEHALIQPMHVKKERSEKIDEMIKDDLVYIINNIYKPIILDGSTLKDNFVLANEIDDRLYWLKRNEKFNIPELQNLRKKINESDDYKRFLLFTQSELKFRDEITFEEFNKNLDLEKGKIIDEINDENIETWLEKFEIIAKQRVYVNHIGFFQNFRVFLEGLSYQKPELCCKILEIAFERKMNLRYFLDSFMFGFRKSGNFDHCDIFINKIVQEKDLELICSLINSMTVLPTENLEELIRSEDIDLLEEIIKKKDKFEFLKEFDKDKVKKYLYNQLARVLVLSLSKSQDKIEQLMKILIEDYPDYFHVYLLELRLSKLTIQNLSNEFLDYLLDKMVEMKRLDWSIDGFLFEVVKRGESKKVMNLFKRRIVKDFTENTGKGFRTNPSEYYEPVPYHFNGELIKMVSNDKDEVKSFINDLVNNMTKGWSLYNNSVAKLLSGLFSGYYEEVLGKLVERGSHDDLYKVTNLIESMEGTHYDLCFEIVKQTDDEEILSAIGSSLYKTGVVTGDYGFINAFKAKIASLNDYLNKYDDTKVKTFINEMIKQFEEKIRKEELRVDKDKAIRRIEFEN